jgi:hypothetical protein
MARIVVVCHEHDLYPQRHFLMQEMSACWQEEGHEVVVHEGRARAPACDLGIVHVDATVVPRAYVDALAEAKVVVNGGALDIGKRTYSENLVGPFDAYPGPVIVKTNLNSGGVPEWLHESVARTRGLTPEGPPARHFTGRYPIYASYAQVPVALRLDPELVVERFLPERDPRGYASRHYLFFGDAERCSRMVGPRPVVKAADVFERAPVEVPEEIRAWRRKLGVDYGKIDFVVHDGRPVLLDVNRTPALPRGEFTETIREGARVLARGLASLLR